MSDTQTGAAVGDFDLRAPELRIGQWAQPLDTLSDPKKWVLHGPVTSPLPNGVVPQSDVKNPKDAIAGTKIPMHLFPATAIVLGSLGLLDGREKYGESNFLATPVNASVYIAAALRHLYKLLAGIDNDEESGLPQEAHILACIAIIVDAREAGTLVDDRRFNSQHLLPFMEKMTPFVSQIKAKHAGKNPKHYTIADNAETK